MQKLIFMLLLFCNVDLLNAQCACCSSPSSFSGGDAAPTTVTLKKNQWLGELYGDYRSFSGIIYKQNAHDQLANTNSMTVQSMVVNVLGIKYGITKRISVSIQQPYFWINATPKSSNTFGDLLTQVNVVAINKNKTNISLQAGVEWPTGQNVQYANGNSITTGSGSYDAVAGVNALRFFKRSSLRANAFFKYTTKGFNDTYFGNFFTHSLSYSYSLLNSSSCLSDSLIKNKLSINATVQWLGELSEPQVRYHVLIANTGRYTNLAGLGLTFSYKGFSIPISVNVPFYQYIYGNQNQTNFRLRIGITKTFN